MQRFLDSSHYNSTAEFLNFFKGIYIKANFGASSLLNIGRINLNYYYHYHYTLKDIHGQDSIATARDNIVFPANQEVRQVNVISHPNRSTIINIPDSVNYISAPANIQTRIGVPLNRIQNRLNAGLAGKKLQINAALIRADVTETVKDTLLHPFVKYMLIIKEDSIDNFFNNNKLQDEKYAVLAGYTYESTGTTGIYNNFYSFDISKLIANELKIAKEKGIAPAENLNLRLIPVSVSATTSSSSSTSTVTSIKQEYLMNAVTIKSGKNPISPMKLKIIYSGF